jgi:hypothetical protein
MFLLLRDKIHETIKFGNVLTLNRNGKACIDVDQTGAPIPGKPG